MHMSEDIPLRGNMMPWSEGTCGVESTSPRIVRHTDSWDGGDRQWLAECRSSFYGDLARTETHKEPSSGVRWKLGVAIASFGFVLARPPSQQR